MKIIGAACLKRGKQSFFPQSWDSKIQIFRVKTEEETKQEEDEYSQWLKGQKKELTDKQDENELEPLKDYWNNPKLEKDEVFLRDYLLNKRYLENENDDYIPTYEEIIHDSDEGLSEDEKNIDKQEEFENKYNFRFEEPDEEYVSIIIPCHTHTELLSNSSTISMYTSI